MNRKQIRRIGANTIPCVTVSLKNITPTLGLTRPSTSSQTYLGKNDNNLLSEVIRGTLEQMGVQRYDLAAAMLFHAINSMFPVEQGLDFRRLVAWGITVGADYTVEQEEHKEGKPGSATENTVIDLVIKPFPAFPLAVQQQGQPEVPVSKLWTPGDPV
jgi:hypothetical protein